MSCRCCLWILHSVSVFWVSYWDLCPLVVDFCIIKYRSNFIILHVDIQFSQHSLFKIYFFYCVLLASLWSMRWLYLHLLIFGYSTLFHWSTSVIVCQYHTVVTTALEYIESVILKYGMVIFPVLFFFFFLLRIILTFWGIL